MPTIGNTTRISQLTKMATQSMLPHSILLVGPEHIGKTHIGHVLAKEILQSKEENLETHPEFIFVQKAEDAHTLTIDDIRRVIEQQKHTAFNSSKRVIMISGIHTASIQAANALLKSIEEPSSNTHFILTAIHTQHTPQTILSRCAVYHLAHASQVDMMPLVEDMTEEARVKKILTWAAGRPGLLKQLQNNDELHGQWYDESRQLLHLLTSTHDKRLAWVEDIIGKGAKAAKKDELYQRLDRTIVMLRALLFSHGLKKKTLAAQIVASLDHARTVKEKLKRNIQPKGLFDSFVLSLPRL